MVFKKYHLLLSFAIIFTMAVSMVLFSVPTAAAAADDTAIEIDAGAAADAPEDAIVGGSWGGNGNRLNLGYLQFGDIISVKGVIVGAGLGEWWIGYSHDAVYIGNGQMIEAWASGVRITTTSQIRNADVARIDRVSTSYSKKVGAVNFMKSKIGKPYDYKWLTYIGGKEVYGSSYYCSELAWAGYKTQGVDIDRYTGWSWRYGYNVAPQEIVDDGNTYYVSYSS
jgi:uncharacterized protein YycO